MVASVKHLEELRHIIYHKDAHPSKVLFLNKLENMILSSFNMRGSSAAIFEDASYLVLRCAYHTFWKSLNIEPPKNHWGDLIEGNSLLSDILDSFCELTINSHKSTIDATLLLPQYNGLTIGQIITLMNKSDNRFNAHIPKGRRINLTFKVVKPEEYKSWLYSGILQCKITFTPVIGDTYYENCFNGVGGKCTDDTGILDKFFESKGLIQSGLFSRPLSDYIDEDTEEVIIPERNLPIEKIKSDFIALFPQVETPDCINKIHEDHHYKSNIWKSQLRMISSGLDNPYNAPPQFLERELGYYGIPLEGGTNYFYQKSLKRYQK